MYHTEKGVLHRQGGPFVGMGWAFNWGGGGPLTGVPLYALHVGYHIDGEGVGGSLTGGGL